MNSDLVLVADRLADAPFDLFRGKLMALRSLDFLHQDQFLQPTLVDEGKRDPAILAQRRVSRLHRRLDILRIVIVAVDDDHVLDAAGDVNVAGFVEKSEIAGAQPMRVFLARDGRREGFGVAAGFCQ